MASSTTASLGLPAVPRSITKVVVAKRQLEGGGFIVRRGVGGRELDYVSPFLMLDHFGPIEVKPGEGIGAPDHPHRGFETVGYMKQGGISHKDSVGNSGSMGPGDVQWMTAGSGIIHSEMPTADSQELGGHSEGFQLWVNLPAKIKMTKPRYQEVPSARIPEYVEFDDGTPAPPASSAQSVESKDGKKPTYIKFVPGANEKLRVRVIAGKVGDKTAVIDTHTPIMYLDVMIHRNGAEFTQPVPADYNGFAYIYRGRGAFGSSATACQESDTMVFGAGTQLTVRNTSDEPLHFLLIAGTPINEPVARYGPFVMNTQSELRQAFLDFQSGRMGRIDGEEERRALTEQAVAAKKAREQSQGKGAVASIHNEL